MTQREKLIELLEKADDSAIEEQSKIEKEIFTQEEFYEHIADYLLENGVIVPPCKAGDKFYYLAQYAVNGEIKNDFKVFEEVVYSIEEFENELIIYDEGGISYGADCIFSTKEEAEEKLKEWNEKDEI